MERSCRTDQEMIQRLNSIVDGKHFTAGRVSQWSLIKGPAIFLAGTSALLALHWAVYRRRSDR